MRKVIAGINMTIDGFCDHTLVMVDDEIHQHYTELLKSAGTIIWGRITYQLMEYWPKVVKNPTGNKATDEFAITIDDISKLVFSHSLKTVEWNNTRLAKGDLKEEVAALKQGAGKDILVGSPSLIVGLTNLNLIDQYQLCVHPLIAGKGLPLFKNITDKTDLTLIRTKTFGCGAITLYYEPVKNNS